MENDWIACKQKVDELPNDYIRLVDDMQKTKPEKVRLIQHGKGVSITCAMKPIEGFEVQMQMIKHDDKGVQRAWYIAWNANRNVCYIRDIKAEDPYNL